MQNMILIVLSATLFFGCTEEVPRQNENSIYGTWQLVEIFDGGSPKPNQSVMDGYTLTLKTSGQAITTHQTIGCDGNHDQLEGIFLLKKIDSRDAVIFEFYCPPSNEKIKDVEFYFDFEDDLLVLTPTNRVNTCWEGCFYRFKKIADGGM